MQDPDNIVIFNESAGVDTSEEDEQRAQDIEDIKLETRSPYGSPGKI